MHEHYDGDRRTHYRIFDSVEEATRPENCRREAAIYYGSSFTGGEFRSVSQAVDATARPWEKGEAIIDDMLRRLAKRKLPRPTSMRRKKFWNVDNGSYLDIDRLRQGHEWWLDSKRKRVSAPRTLTIICNVGATAEVAASDMLWRGAAALILTKLLEEAGYRVELWVANRGNCRGIRRLVLAAPVKRSGDPLNIGLVASTMSAWFHRIILFACRNAENRSIHGGNYGSQPLKREDCLEIVSDEQALVVEELFSEAEAMEFVASVVAKYTKESSTR